MADFVTAAELAGHMQQDLDTYTAQQAIRGASAAIRAAAGWHIDTVTNQTYTITGTDIQHVIIPAMNITIISVVADGTTLALTTGYTVETFNSRMAHVSLVRAAKLVTITYDAGYATVSDGAKDLCLELAADRYDNPTRLRSETVGAVSVTYAGTGGSAVDLDTDHRLNDYRLPGFA